MYKAGRERKREKERENLVFYNTLTEKIQKTSVFRRSNIIIKTEFLFISSSELLFSVPTLWEHN